MQYDPLSAINGHLALSDERSEALTGIYAHANPYPGLSRPGRSHNKESASRHEYPTVSRKLAVSGWDAPCGTP